MMKCEQFYLFPQFGLSFLYRSHNHVTNRSGGHTIQSATESCHGDDVQILGA